MRRKSTRNSQKVTPEKVKDIDTSQKIRRSRRRKRTPSKSSDSDDEPIIKPKTPEEIPDTTTKSHPPSDNEGEPDEEPVWKVTSSDKVPQGEIQKLKICLTRPSPDSSEKTKALQSKSKCSTEEGSFSEDSSPRRTRSRGSLIASNDGLSSQGDEDTEEKEGKGKSKGKHKSKIEKSPRLNEPDLQSSSEISDNAQVTTQSPPIDNPVDNEHDCKVDADDSQNAGETPHGGNTSEESVPPIETSELKPVSQSTVPISSISDVEHSEEPAVDDHHETIVNSPVVSNSEVLDEDSAIETKSEHCSTNDVTLNKEVPQITELEGAQLGKNEVLPLEESKAGDRSNDTASDKNDSIETEDTRQERRRSSRFDEIKDSSPQQHANEAADQLLMSSTLAEIKTMCAKLPETAITAKEDEIEVSAETCIAVPPSLVNRNETRGWKLNRCTEPTESNLEINEANKSCFKPVNQKWLKTLDTISTLVNIDLEGIRVVWPAIEFPEEPDLDVKHEKERRRFSTESLGRKTERKISTEQKSDNEKPSYDFQYSIESTTQNGEDNSNIIAFNRKISIVEDTASKLKPPPSPAKNPSSNILYIMNLVRPFTLKQLKELLQRTGDIKDDGFWTDRIKSKCYVEYETVEEAEATREALHGVQWPIGNGKKLIIDYATAEEFAIAKNPPAPPAAAPTPPDVPVSVKENFPHLDNQGPIEERLSKDPEKKRAEGPVREWDIGKNDGRRERSRSRERSRKHRRHSPSPSDFITRKQKKMEEFVPQKLMDDLFLKTKASPSIYWQPLSPDEIALKQQQRLIRMEEHKRRMEENFRMKAREMGRGAVRRRYD